MELVWIFEVRLYEVLIVLQSVAVSMPTVWRSRLEYWPANKSQYQSKFYAVF